MKYSCIGQQEYSSWLPTSFRLNLKSRNQSWEYYQKTIEKNFYVKTFIVIYFLLL